MIKEHLTRDLNLGKLHNAYLIDVSRPEDALASVRGFLEDNFYKHQEINSCGDFVLVQRTNDNVRNITVDQIRHLQEFSHKTSVISGQKTVIIYGAEYMNVNAANSCLKLLEDTPKNTHFFLITSNSAAILPTIRSRCAKINDRTLKLLTTEQAIDDYYIMPFLKSTNMTKHMDYLKDLTGKDQSSWIEFGKNAGRLLARIGNRLLDKNFALSRLETDFFHQLMPISLHDLARKHYEAEKLINDTVTLDLDLRAGYILLVDIVK